MSLNVPLLRRSFALVIERQPKLTTRFYEILFDRHPQARPLFERTSADAQSKMLQEALVAVMDHLDDASWLERTLGALGRKHVDYGVTDEMYDWVGAALLAALAEASGDEWTDELAEAWKAAYGAVAGLMKAKAAAA